MAQHEDLKLASDEIHGIQLWKSDGTTEGTVLLTAIDRGPYAYNWFAELTDVNGELFMHADGQLWKSDGTAAGTVMVRNLDTYDLGSYPYSLTNVNGTLFFGARGPDYPPPIEDEHWHLWKSDGTARGTVQVSDINIIDPTYFSPNGPERNTLMIAVDGTLFTNTGWGGFPLYRTKPRIH